MPRPADRGDADGPARPTIRGGKPVRRRRQYRLRRSRARRRMVTPCLSASATHVQSGALLKPDMDREGLEPVGMFALRRCCSPQHCPSTTVSELVACQERTRQVTMDRPDPVRWPISPAEIFQRKHETRSLVPVPFAGGGPMTHRCSAAMAHLRAARSAIGRRQAAQARSRSPARPASPRCPTSRRSRNRASEVEAGLDEPVRAGRNAEGDGRQAAAGNLRGGEIARHQGRSCWSSASCRTAARRRSSRPM